MKKRVLSLILSLALLGSSFLITAVPAKAAKNGEEKATEETSRNNVTNQGKLNTNAFIQLPMGAVSAKNWLQQQLYLQKNGLTSAIHDQYELYGPNNGWRGGTGDGWEKGAYYLRGLIATAWVLDDEELKAKSMEWIDFILDSQRENGFMGPINDGDGSGNNWDWWPRMVILQVIRDYYEATELEGQSDSRVLPFFEKYFHYQIERLKTKRLESWAASRGGDNIEVLLWYYNRVYDQNKPGDTDWIIDLALLLEEQTRSQDGGQDWIDIFTNTTVRQHVVNTTQAMKTPAVLSQLPGREEDKKALKQGIFNMNLDHGRVDNLANSDEIARDNLPYRGAELCSVVESLLSNEIALKITGESWLGDEMERSAYNSLPAGYAPDYTGHNYFQAQNQVMATHGHHEFDSDHGDSSAYGALTGYECCFPNMHMGWPKFIQNMWMATTDNGLAVVAYGPNKVKTLVADGKVAVFDQVTDYPFKDTVNLNYSGEDANFPLKLRLPAWCESPSVNVNGTAVGIEKEEGFATIKRNWKAGDSVAVTFPMEVRTSTWYNNSAAVEYGPLIFALKVEEDWRLASDDDVREIKYEPVGEFDRKEVYPASDWNYALVIDEDNPGKSVKINVADQVALQPFTLSNVPITMEATGQLVPEWQLKGNVVPESPYSPIRENKELQNKIELVPYGCTRLRITQMPTVGNAEAEGVTIREAKEAVTYTEYGEKVVEFDNLMVPSAEEYTLKIHYNGTGQLRMNINQKYDEKITFDDSGVLEFENLTTIIEDPNKYFHFGYGKYNNIRFFGADGVTITKLEIIPEGLFTEPVIKSADLSADGKSVSINTNIERDSGIYMIRYGTSKDDLAYTASNFYAKRAVINGLDPEKTYYFQAVVVAGGETKVSETVEAAKGTGAQGPSVKDDFSDPAASRELWEVMDPNNVVSFEDGKMVFGESDNVKVLTGSEQWNDYTVVAHVAGKAPGDRDFGLMVRTSNLQDGTNGYNGYYVGLNTSNGKVTVGFANGSWNRITEAPGIEYEEGTVYELKVVVAGERLAVYVDGVKKYDEVLSETAYIPEGTNTVQPIPIYLEGCVGFRSWNQKFEVHDFEIRNILPEEYEELGMENVLFYDGFSDSDASKEKWTVLDPQGCTRFEAGKLFVGKSNNVKILAGSGEQAWEDYAIETTLLGGVNPSRDFGVIFRCSDATDESGDSYRGYYVGIDTENNHNGLKVGYADNGWHEIEKVPAFTYQPGHPYKLKILVCGTKFKVYVDDQFIYELEDSKFTYGSAGVRSYEQDFEVDDFKVRQLTASELKEFETAGFQNMMEKTVTSKAGVLFTDDFSDSGKSQESWMTYGDKGKIAFEDNKLVFGFSDNVKAAAGDPGWTDYVAEASIALDGTNDNNAGMIYRSTNPRSGSDGYDGFYFGIGNNNNGTGYWISGWSDGGWHEMSRKSCQVFENGQEYRLKAVVYGEMVALYLEDELVTTFTNVRYEKGLVGLRSYNKAFSAGQVTVREIEEGDLTAFEGKTRFIDETFSAYRTVQLKFPKFSSSRNYKIIYGEEPGMYTHEVYGLYHNHRGSISEKLSVSMPENDKDYYMQIVALNGRDYEAVSGEVKVHTGGRLDVTAEKDMLRDKLEEAEAADTSNCVAESLVCHEWAMSYAKQVLAADSSNLMDIRLAKNSLAVGLDNLVTAAAMLERIEVTPPAKKEYAVGESLDLSGMAVKAYYSDTSSKALENKDVTVTGFQSEKAGDVTVTVSYQENGVTKTASFKVTIKAKPVPVVPGDKTKLKILFDSAKKLKAANYTKDSYSQFSKACNEANAILKNAKSTQAQIDKALGALQMAKKGLVKKEVKKNKAYTVKGLKYKVTSTSKRKETVKVIGANSKKVRKVTIPSTVVINDIKCKVTAVGAKAFSGYKRLKQATIGENVKSIGKQAFYKDGKLSRITIQSKRLNSVGKNSLKGINAKAKIKVPKGKKTSYQRLFGNKGQKKTVKIK